MAKPFCIYNPYSGASGDVSTNRPEKDRALFVVTTSMNIADYISNHDLLDYQDELNVGDAIIVAASDRVSIVRVTALSESSVTVSAEFPFSDDVSSDIAGINSRVSSVESFIQNQQLDLPGQIQFATATGQLLEGGNDLEIVLQRSGGTNGTIVVTIDINPNTTDTAALSTEYTGTNDEDASALTDTDQITFASGVSQRTITLSPGTITGDGTATLKISTATLDGTTDTSVIGARDLYTVSVVDTTAGIDTTPTFTPSTITATTDQTLGSLQQASVVVSAFDDSLLASVNVGQLKRNNGAWVDAGTDVTVYPGDTIYLQHNASGTNEVTVTQTLTVGTTTIDFASTTVAAGGSVSAFFTDGFESGDRSHTEGGAYWRPTDGSVTVSTTEAKTGTYSLRFAYPNPSDGTNPAQYFQFPTPTNELWIKYDLYVPSNYAPTTSSNNKFLAIFADPYSSPGFQVNFSLYKDGTGSSSLELHRYRNGAEQSVLYPSTTGFIAPADHGTWITIVARVKVPTDSTTSDGVMQMWKNGTQWVDYTNLNNFGSSGRNYIDKGYIMGWANSGYDATAYFYVDNVQLSLGSLL